MINGEYRLSVMNIFGYMMSNFMGSQYVSNRPMESSGIPHIEFELRCCCDKCGDECI